ncbi:hypothetical protein HORM4_660013 [Vibrio harveyi]|nr:hypothetical protein HORM4_660013 [Vibrio harveyi]
MVCLWHAICRKQNWQYCLRQDSDQFEFVVKNETSVHWSCFLLYFPLTGTFIFSIVY